MLDFHSHILPRVDHGSKSTEVSLKQLDLAAHYGVDKIVSTSHFYPHIHNVDSFLDMRNKAYYHLRANMSDKHPDIKVAAEVLMCEGIERLEGLSSLCLHGTDVILLEIPSNNFSELLVDSVRKIKKSIASYPILVHAERYSPEIIEKFLKIGVKLQLNGKAFSHILTPRHIRAWLDGGYVVALGSDIHGDDKSAYQALARAKIKLGKYYEQIENSSLQLWNSSKHI